MQENIILQYKMPIREMGNAVFAKWQSIPIDSDVLFMIGRATCLEVPTTSSK